MAVRSVSSPLGNQGYDPASIALIPSPTGLITRETKPRIQSIDADKRSSHSIMEMWSCASYQKMLPMSALGQKQTYTVHKRMSALPPESDAECVHSRMSA